MDPPGSSNSSQQSIGSNNSVSLRGVPVRNPRTPPSNFKIQVSSLLGSDSSSSGDDDEDENIFAKPLPPKRIKPSLYKTGGMEGEGVRVGAPGQPMSLPSTGLNRFTWRPPKHIAPQGSSSTTTNSLSLKVEPGSSPPADSLPGESSDYFRLPPSQESNFTTDRAYSSGSSFEPLYSSTPLTIQNTRSEQDPRGSATSFQNPTSSHSSRQNSNQINQSSQINSIKSESFPGTPSPSFQMSSPQSLLLTPPEPFQMPLSETFRGACSQYVSRTPSEDPLPFRSRPPSAALRTQPSPPLSEVSGSVLDDNDDTGTTQRAEIRRREQILEGRPDNGSKDVVFCTLWVAGKIAVSYYELETGQLFMLPDISDTPPDFDILRSAYNQVQPSYVLINKNSDDRFIRVIKELTGHGLVDDVTHEDEDPLQNNQRRHINRSISNAVHLYPLASKEFSPEACKSRVQNIHLSYEPKNSSESEHLVFLTSLIPFTNEVMIRTLGGLLKFLDKSAIEIFQLELSGGQVHVVDVNLFKMDDMVLVDETAWRSLQMFNIDIHPSSFKQGSGSGNKEGLSVYSILNQCVTIQGAKKLRSMLLRPSRIKQALRGRYDMIDYFIKTENMELTRSITDCLKHIENIPKLLHRLSLLHATANEWKDLYNSFYQCLLLGETCASLDRAPELLKSAANSEHLMMLRFLTQKMLGSIDFDQTVENNRIVAREGVDEELDRRKRQYGCLPEIMSLVTVEEIAELPPFVEQCCAVYIPEIGYLLAVTLWRENLNDEELEIPNLDFRFKTAELAYYKSPRMRELDVVLGDCSIAILEKETLIMVELSQLILEQSSGLLKFSDIISEIDSLIAMSKVSNSYNFVRPILLPPGEKLRIVDGWHPLSDILCQFVRNTTMFADKERVAVITGPNASGKSIYLKQIGIIVLMALVGCFVPASYAQIPLIDKLFTRVHAVESVSTGFSSFMVDINQMSLAIRSSSRNSLIIIDEFGKGTSEADGISILAGSIQNFLDQGHECPTVFLSTHFYSMLKYLQPSPLLKYQTMKFIHENDTITYLYELLDGKCEKSFAASVAKTQGVPPPVVERIIEVENISTGQSENKIEGRVSEDKQEMENLLVSIADGFHNINFDKVDPIDYWKSIKERVAAIGGCVPPDLNVEEKQEY